ncbi:hypothetical protein K461DRAFT_279018 [Myriangium duriaei CBS 260.36]|uniref:Uncharacterized protein n=1 Tax=Myriangium duriaei CBS 260.36 TaxID=1168546 RepID=A0A9P4MMI3_9PEZI|nr:hypothetical protein K461DRAFT_279018 [Myriangium duriaei CBS 260.36]
MQVGAEEEGRHGIFLLVESHEAPGDRNGFKRGLKDSENFETEFIGASEQECQQWALEKQSECRGVESDIICIADARSADDGTVMMQRYARYQSHWDFGKHGKLLPPEVDIWYTFRVAYKKADLIFSSLKFGSEDCVFPVYYGARLKDRLVDERGVFDADEAERLQSSGDPKITEWYVEE